jgi:hypothetical protein
MSAPDAADRLVELLARARAATVMIGTVDEAQLLAVGWIPPARGASEQYLGAATPYDFPGLAAAQQALLAAGLGRRGASDTPAELSATGGLRDYLDLVRDHRLQTSNWICWIPDARTPVPRLVRRITTIGPIGEAAAAPVALIERMAVPAPTQPQTALGIEIVLAPVEDVAAELAGLAYREPTEAERAAGEGLEAVLIGPDRALPNVPSRLVRGWDSRTATLRWRSLTLFGRRAPGERLARKALTVHRLRPDGYRDHVRRRLLVPEPRL